MIFIPFLLVFLSVYFAIQARQKEMELFTTLAIVLAIAAVGSAIILFLALPVAP